MSLNYANLNQFFKIYIDDCSPNDLYHLLLNSKGHILGNKSFLINFLVFIFFCLYLQSSIFKYDYNIKYILEIYLLSCSHQLIFTSFTFFCEKNSFFFCNCCYGVKNLKEFFYRNFYFWDLVHFYWKWVR